MRLQVIGSGLQRFGHLVQYGASGFGGVGGLRDGASYDQVAGAGAQGVGGRGDAFLVAHSAACGADPRDDENALGAGKGAEGGHLLRRADKAAQAGTEAHARQQLDLFGGLARHADGGCLRRVHAGENRNGEEFGGVGDGGGCFAGGGEHGGAAGGVERQHAGSKSGGGAHGARHSVGDVVQFEIEKDIMAALQDGLEHGGAGGYEEFQTDLEPGAGVIEPVEKVGRGGGGGDIERNDEALPGALAQVFRTGLCRLRAWHTRTVGDWAGLARQNAVRGRRGWLRNRCPALAPKTKRANAPDANWESRSGLRRPIARDSVHWRNASGRKRVWRSCLGKRTSSAYGGVWGRGLALVALLLLACAGLRAQPAYTNPLNHDPLVREAFAHFYELDFPGMVDRFELFHEMHPGDPQATALLLNAVVFQQLYELDLLDTTFYANDGFLTGRHIVNENPEGRKRIFALSDEAVREADWRIGRNPNDVDALFARAWARSLRCAYIAMAERSFRAGFGLATKAKNDAERVLQLNPNYVDAKLITGVYQYVVGALPFPFKFLIGFAGITGSKSKGMQMLRDDAQRGVITRVDASTVIALFLRREGKYKQAIVVVRGLEAEYPRNFLFRLEEANLRKDDGQGMAAVAAYDELLALAAKPNYFASAKLELAYFGLGDAERGQRHYDEAAQAYEHAAFTPNVGAELKIRSLLAAGQCHDLEGKRELALRDYRMAIDAGPNTSRADIARKLMRSPYKGS